MFYPFSRSCKASYLEKMGVSEKRRYHCYRHTRRGLCYPLPTSRRFEDRQSARETFIGQAQATGLPAVSARFVHDCLEQHTILDTEPYQFTPASHKRKRTARSTSPVEPESEDEEEEEEDEEQKPAEAEPESEPAPEIDEAERKRLAKNLKERQRRQRIQNELRAFRDSSRPESPVASAGCRRRSHRRRKRNVGVGGRKTQTLWRLPLTQGGRRVRHRPPRLGNIPK